MKKTYKIIVLAAALLLVLVPAGVVLGKYIFTNMSTAQMLSSHFHISSNYLEDSDLIKEYTVSDWGDTGILIQLYNYEKENISLIAEDPIVYKVSVSDGWNVTVKDDLGTLVAPAEGQYTMPADGSVKVTHILQIKAAGASTDTSKPVEVTVTTTSPYSKQLKAKFTLEGKDAPEYQIEDKGDYCVVTIYSNDYADYIDVAWTEKYSPDNTNVLMATWIDTDQKQDLLLEANHTYELIFFEKEGVSYSKDRTRVEGFKIQIGE